MKKKAIIIMKFVKILLLLVIVLLAAAVAATGILFKEEISIIRSVQKGSDGPYYMMEYKNGYHLDEMLEKDISSDADMRKYLVDFISHGFYNLPEVEESHIGCSAITALNEAGHTIWGRNFDWNYSTPIIVRSTPKDGYASLSTCEYTNLTGEEGTYPEGFYDKFIAVGAYFVPMDGINEKGLCVTELEVNEGGQKLVDTEKKNITITMATRLLLDKAATVDEAIELLNQYDIAPSGGISGHLAISDRSGRMVVAEFMDGKVEIVETNMVTNFNVRNGDIEAGGESAKRRYLILKDAYEEAGGVMTAEEIKEAMGKVSTTEGKWQTKWTIIYEDTGESTGEISAVYYWNADFEHAYPISMKVK